MELPWQYFAQSLTRSSANLVESASLITKVYFPRLIIPTSGVLSGLVDFGVGFGVMVGLMVAYRIQPTPAAALLPAFMLLAVLLQLTIGLVSELALENLKDGILAGRQLELDEQFRILDHGAYSTQDLDLPIRVLDGQHDNDVSIYRFALVSTHQAELNRANERGKGHRGCSHVPRVTMRNRHPSSLGWQSRWKDLFPL